MKTTKAKRRTKKEMYDYYHSLPLSSMKAMEWLEKYYDHVLRTLPMPRYYRQSVANQMAERRRAVFE